MKKPKIERHLSRGTQLAAVVTAFADVDAFAMKQDDDRLLLVRKRWARDYFGRVISRQSPG